MKKTRIFENKADFDEARIRKGTQAPRKFKSGDLEGEEIVKKWDYGFKEGNNTNIPDYWIYNPTLRRGDEIMIVPLGCDEYETFINENSDWLTQLGVLHDLEPQIVACKRTAGPPRRKKLDTAVTGEGSRLPIRTRIKKYFNKIIYDELGYTTEKGKEFQEELNNRSIPPLMISPKDDETRPFVDRHNTKFENNHIFYRIHSYNSYESIESFLRSVVNRLQGEEPEGMKTHHLAYQFNRVYSNWDPTQKNKQMYRGKSAKYGLDVTGLEEANLDATMRMVFEIEGRRRNDAFTWIIKMNCKFGKKAPQDFQIKTGFVDVPMMASVVEGGYLDDKNIIGQNTITLSPEELQELQNDPEKEITSLFSVQESLRQAIYDFKEKVKAIEPESMIELGNITLMDNPGDEMNEGKLMKIVREILKKSKN